jgi:hypothetical protein
MLYRSFEKFNQDMEKIGGLGDGTLDLSHYAVLEPGNREAEAFLGHLEEEGYLPLTVACLSEQGRKLRFFLAPDGAHPLTIHCNGMALALRTGRGDSAPVDCQRFRRGSYKVFGDPSYLIMNPVRLPGVTFNFLRFLALIPQGVIDLPPGELQREAKS